MESRRSLRARVRVLLDSGMFSAVFFLVNMLFYVVAVPVCAWGDTTSCSCLYLLGAVGFTVESCVDLAWSCRSTSGDATARSTATRGESGEGVLPVSSTSERGDAGVDGQRFGGQVNWSRWSALFFLLPSLGYLAAALLDPGLVGPQPGETLKKRGIDSSELARGLNWAAGLLFVLDAILCILGWWFASQPAEERSCTARRCDMDWNLLAGMVFLAAALLGILQQCLHDTSVGMNALCCGVWTVSAVFYILAAYLPPLPPRYPQDGCIPTTREDVVLCQCQS